ncbi:prenyltransferase [Thermococcus profundus]|uniref:Prenyltransferase n=1 Tax=Thermococcus profundus TaxID=49899 RepID=A0A2Z2MCP9_THEPR|nr:prenyltransferase/squalene oxidase repeat-containing protein [Thermococcus profundus]ASJ03313.1 prenyltransferase [Thermococcus profundus]
MRKASALRITVVILLWMIMLVPLAVAVPITDGSAGFLRRFGESSGQIRHISLTIVALSEANGKVRDDLTPKIRDLTRDLISYQNPDGGWGYFPGSVSNVLDTSYALIALSESERYFENTDDFFKVKDAREKAVDFIRSSLTGKAWGYVSGTSPMFYPTVVVLWALGESGFNATDPDVSSALSVLDDLPRYVDDKTALGLKLIAFKFLGVPVENFTVGELMGILENDELSPTQRAILTYALTLYSEPTFEVVAQIAELDRIKHVGGNMVFWADTPEYPISITDTVTPTAYALLAVSQLVPSIESAPTGSEEIPCDELISYQNPDGGWGVYAGSPSNEEATYYALLAVEACYPAPDVVEKALNWTEGRFKDDEILVLNESRLTVGYYYSLMTLLHFDRLSEGEKKHAVQVIKSVEMEKGKWGIKGLGPQPAETAMAISALLALGVEPSDPDIKAAKEWLISISSTGWGLYYQVGIYPFMFDLNVLDTLTVLKALEPIASEDELRPHINWLVSQRSGGGWPYMVEYSDFNGTGMKGKPRVDLTVEATLFLSKHGLDYTEETLEFVRGMRDSGAIANDTIETASAIIFLSKYERAPMVDLSDVRNALETSSFAITVPERRIGDAKAVMAYLEEDFGSKFSLGPLSLIDSVNSIALVGYGDIDVSRYNRRVSLSVAGDNVIINDFTYPRENTVLLIPGRTARGVVLFVVYDDSAADIARLIFDIGYVRYMQGNAVVVHFEDRNGDGKVQLNEVTAETVG